MEVFQFTIFVLTERENSISSKIAITDPRTRPLLKTMLEMVEVWNMLLLEQT